MADSTTANTTTANTTTANTTTANSTTPTRQRTARAARGPTMCEGVGQQANEPLRQTVEDLVIEYRPMAQRLARRYSHGTSTDPDLNQVADLGLFLAATRYDPDTGAFRPYAMATIVGELKKHLRSNGWTVKVPRRLQEATITIAVTTERLEQQLKQSPTPQQVADETGLTVETVLLALQARNSRFSVEPQATDPMTVDDLDSIEALLDIRGAAASLADESRELVGLRYGHELTQREIATRLDISQSQVHRRLVAVRDDLRDVLDSRSDDR